MPNIRIRRETMTRVAGHWSELCVRVRGVRRPQAPSAPRDVPALREALVLYRSALNPHAAHLFTSTLLVSGTASIEKPNGGSSGSLEFAPQ